MRCWYCFADWFRVCVCANGKFSLVFKRKSNGFLVPK